MNQKMVGCFLKKLRNEKTMTQEQLAEMLGVSNRSVSRWENGVTMPDLDLLIQLAKFYDVEIALGFNLGILLTGALYSSRYITKIKAMKMRLLKRNQ